MEERRQEEKCAQSLWHTHSVREEGERERERELTSEVGKRDCDEDECDSDG